MEEDLFQLVEDSTSESLECGLARENILAFCTKHSLSLAAFHDAFATLVAVHFACGKMSYWAADTAMNAMVAPARFEVSGLAWEIYEAFDAGELARREGPGIFPWQTHTLPEIMNILVRESLLPRT